MNAITPVPAACQNNRYKAVAEDTADFGWGTQGNRHPTELEASFKLTEVHRECYKKTNHFLIGVHGKTMHA